MEAQIEAGEEMRPSRRPNGQPDRSYIDRPKAYHMGRNIKKEIDYELKMPTLEGGP